MTTKQAVVLSALMAGALSVQPAVAQSGNLAGLGPSMPLSFGRALTDSEVENLRGGYLPPGINVFINIGNAHDSGPGTNVAGAAATGVHARSFSAVSGGPGNWIVTLFRDPDG